MKIMYVVIGILLTSYSMAKDVSIANDLYMANDAGGWVVLTNENCNFVPAIKLGLNHRAYASEDNGTIHEGCWNIPSISEAPISPEVKIFPVVNTWWEELQSIEVYPADLFSSEKTREEFKGDL